MVMRVTTRRFLIDVMACRFAAWALLISAFYEVCATILMAMNVKITDDRIGLTRSAFFLVIIIIRTVGNLHVFKGTDDFSGYGCFYVRLYWTGFGLLANIFMKHTLLSVVLHIIVGPKRTWDMEPALVESSGLSVLNLAISGLMLITFITIHLLQVLIW